MSALNDSMSLSMKSQGYSADVTLALALNGERPGDPELIQLMQAGPRRVVLRENRMITAERGEVVMTVDGAERRWAIEIGAADEGEGRGIAVRMLEDVRVVDS